MTSLTNTEMLVGRIRRASYLITKLTQKPTSIESVYIREIYIRMLLRCAKERHNQAEISGSSIVQARRDYKTYPNTNPDSKPYVRRPMPYKNSACDSK